MSNDGDVYEVWGILGHEDDPNIPRPVPSNKPSASTEKPATPAPIATTKPVPSSKHKPPDSSISSPGRYPIIPFKRNLIPQLHENSLRAALRGPWIDLGQDALPKPASPAASRSISPTQSNDPSPTNQGGDTSGCVAKARASNSSKKSPANGGGRVIQRSVNTARMRAAPYNLAARKILPAPSSSNAPSASSDVSNQTPCLAPGPANQFSTFTKPGPDSLRNPDLPQPSDPRQFPEHGRSRGAKPRVPNPPLVPMQSQERGDSGRIAQPRALNARLRAAPYDLAAAARKICSKAPGPSSSSNTLSANGSRDFSNCAAAANPFSTTFPHRPAEPEVISTNVRSYGRTIISPTSSVSGPPSATENSNRTPSSLEASNPYSVTFSNGTSNHTSSSLEASNPFSVTYAQRCFDSGRDDANNANIVDTNNNSIDAPATADESCQTPVEEEGGQFKLGEVTDWSAFPEIEGVWTQEDEDAKALFAESPYEEQDMDSQGIYTWDSENAMGSTSTGGDVDWGSGDGL